MNVKKLNGGYLVNEESVFVNFNDVVKNLAQSFGEALELAEDKVCPPCEKAHVEDVPANPEVTTPAGVEGQPQV